MPFFVFLIKPLLERKASFRCSPKMASTINEEDRLAVGDKYADCSPLKEAIKIIRDVLHPAERKGFRAL